MEPQQDFFHMAGRSASEYLSENLVQFIRATDTYFSIGNKFRSPLVAPTTGVTTDRSQKLQVRIVPTNTEDSTNYYKARYLLAVGDNKLLDMSSAYFDIRGFLDRGPSFKPYGGTAYNALAPTEGIPNQLFRSAGNTGLVGQAPSTIVIADKAKKGATEAQTIVTTSIAPNPQDGDSPFAGPAEPGEDVGGARALGTTVPPLPARGAYAIPKSVTGAIDLAPTRQYFNMTADDAGVSGAVAVDDAAVVGLPDSTVHAIQPGAPFQMTGGSNRCNFIGFRDCFIGLCYYNCGGALGNFSSQSDQLNLVQDLQDRNTELSYQMYLADLSGRRNYFSMWNEAVDTYCRSCRIFSNDGYEEGPPTYTWPLRGYDESGQINGSLCTIGADGTVTKTANSFADVALGNIKAHEINLPAALLRLFLYSNIAQYLPDHLKMNSLVGPVPPNPNSYNYMNQRLPLPNIIDTWTNIGARWSLDEMDNVNPFNHHRNYGLKYRSQLLGNSRFVNFHIQVPQKFFALKNLLLTPGTYNYEWTFRKDPNMIFQSTLGNDLRADGAFIRYDSVNLYCSYFPMAYETVGELEVMLRNSVNNQSFSDYLGAVNNLYQIPANQNTMVVNIPDRGWGAFRGWSFTRLKQKETPLMGATYDPNFKYSGSIPYLDGTFYLSHTFRQVQIQWDSSVLWPGNDRLLTPNWFEIQRDVQDDSEGFCVAQSNMTKDWFSLQSMGTYNMGYQGFHYPSVTKFFEFLTNFEPMSRQIPDFANNPTKLFDLMTTYKAAPQSQAIWNNSGLMAKSQSPQIMERSGHLYPCNWPYPLIGENSLPYDQVKTQRKFLCDSTLWMIPFSSNFLNMGTLTDLGQNVFYSNTSHSLNMTFNVEPMPEPTYLYLLFGVFDNVVINQPTRNAISAAYLRLPFAAGNATT